MVRRGKELCGLEQVTGTPAIAADGQSSEGHTQVGGGGRRAGTREQWAQQVSLKRGPDQMLAANGRWLGKQEQEIRRCERAGACGLSKSTGSEARSRQIPLKWLGPGGGGQRVREHEPG